MLKISNPHLLADRTTTNVNINFSRTKAVKKIIIIILIITEQFLFNSKFLLCLYFCFKRMKDFSIEQRLLLINFDSQCTQFSNNNIWSNLKHKRNYPATSLTPSFTTANMSLLLNCFLRYTQTKDCSSPTLTSNNALRMAQHILQTWILNRDLRAQTSGEEHGFKKTIRNTHEELLLMVGFMEATRLLV